MSPITIITPHFKHPTPSILPQTQKSFPLEPLSTEQAKALEAHTEAAQRAVEKTNLRQAKSLDFKESKSPAILS